MCRDRGYAAWNVEDITVANGEASVEDSRAAASSPSGVGAPGLARYSQPVIIALLLVSVIAGIRAAGPAVAGRGPLRQDALAIGICLWAALGGLQVALAIRTRRAPDAGHLAGALRKLVRWMAALAMIAIIVIVIVNLTAVKANSNWLNTLQGRSQRRRQPKHPPRRLPAVPAGSSYLLYVLIAVVVLVALDLRGPDQPDQGTRNRRLRCGLADDDSTELHKAVESGRTALRAVDDARAAIIACYVAMEGSLAGAGAARTAAETPDELLARAVASGLIQGPAAGRLTGLFYEARFSSHPLADAAKDDAGQALDVISDELRGTHVIGRAAQ